MARIVISALMLKEINQSMFSNEVVIDLGDHVVPIGVHKLSDKDYAIIVQQINPEENHGDLSMPSM